jgi:hypothetical protein
VQSQLDKTLCVMRDLKDQPVGDFILIISQGEAMNYIYVDAFEEHEDIVIFKKADKVNYVCKKDARFVIVAAGLIELVSNGELMQKLDNDTKALEKLHLEMHPECKDAPGERHAVGQVPGYL